MSLNKRIQVTVYKARYLKNFRHETKIWNRISCQCPQWLTKLSSSCLRSWNKKKTNKIRRAERRNVSKLSKTSFLSTISTKKSLVPVASLGNIFRRPAPEAFERLTSFRERKKKYVGKKAAPHHDGLQRDVQMYTLTVEGSSCYTKIHIRIMLCTAQMRMCMSV